MVFLGIRKWQLPPFCKLLTEEILKALPGKAKQNTKNPLNLKLIVRRILLTSFVVKDRKE